MANKDSKARLLQILQSGPTTSDGAASVLDVPRASVRRLVQQLLRDGHRITSDEQGGYYGTVYRLW